jgi:hypothetical protein
LLPKFDPATSWLAPAISATAIRITRGEISMGTALVACPGILEAVQRWDEIEVDWDSGDIRNFRSGATLRFEPLSSADRLMLSTGGLIPYLKHEAHA